RIVVGVAEIGGIGAPALGAGISTRQQKKKVLRIGEIGDPAPDVDLVGAAANLVLELVVGGGVDLHVEPELPPGPGEELKLQVRRRRRRRGVETELEAPVARRVDAAPVTGFGEQRVGARKVELAKWVLVGLVKAKDPRRQRRLRRHAAAVEEQLQVLAG